MARNEPLNIKSRCGSPVGFRWPSRRGGRSRVDRVWRANVRSRARTMRVGNSFSSNGNLERLQDDDQHKEFRMRRVMAVLSVMAMVALAAGSLQAGYRSPSRIGSTIGGAPQASRPRQRPAACGGSIRAAGHNP